jgi:hypothetical protein
VQIIEKLILILLNYKLMFNSRYIYTVLFIFAATLPACGSSNSVGQKLQTIDSWVATVSMTATAWAEAKVPEVYTKQTLEKAQQELIHEIKTVDLPPQQRQPLQRLNPTVAQIQAAVEHKDKATLQQSLRQQQIHLLSQQVGES